MNAIKKWLLTNERTYVLLSLERIKTLEIEIGNIQAGHGILNKIKRLHALPVMKSELKDLMEKQDDLQSKLEELRWKLKNG